ncbi:HAD family hydrolase [Hymenobacter sp. ASUV-10]|uniref:HAD family hydrolase n=1 Tax=Hymenobacter aranciens TaxID=3063996 RepID=A0ABT9BF41_9BACT|nr:HAD family hydrolase [Hymenobacter sp. ASUV-10]MDO7876309.1 HAD family hydrolase [Hymenobacter sp. ASUV-10]
MARKPVKKQLKPLLILDLDETLIHASSTLLRPDFDFQVFHYYVYKRPGLDHFLRACAERFELAIWSSASDDYVAEVVQHIMPPDIPLAFVWGRSRCTLMVAPQIDDFGYYNTDYPSHYEYAKKLRKVRTRGFDLQQVLIVDDTPHKVRNCYGNAIYPTPYLGQLDDEELPILLKYLETLATNENLRSIEKRQWQQRITTSPE